MKKWIALWFVLGMAVTAADSQPPGVMWVDSAERALKQDHPGVQINRNGTTRLAVHGPGMSPGATPDVAVFNWLDRYGDVLAIPVDQLDERSHNAVGKNQKFTVFRYKQIRDGLPVEGSLIRILVRNGAENEVVYVGARSLVAPSESLRADRISAGQALLNAQELEAYGYLDAWSQPIQVILPGRNGAPAERAWKFVGNDSLDPGSYTFYVDTHDGIVLKVRNNSVDANPAGSGNTVVGMVKGKATPGILPDLPSNPPTIQPLRGARVVSSLTFPGGSSEDETYTDAKGQYEVNYDPFNPSATVTSVGRSQWFYFIDFGGEEVQVLSVPPSLGPIPAATVVHNDQADPDRTQQINVLNHGTLAHDFYKVRQPGFSEIDEKLPVHFGHNRGSPFYHCNAAFVEAGADLLSPAISAGDPVLDYEYLWFWDGDYDPSKDPFDCPSQAFSSIIAHEYGHFLQFQLGIPREGEEDSAFGEGFSDSFTILLYDDPVIGLDNFGEGSGPLRDASEPGNEFPCVDPIDPLNTREGHDCGLVVAGVWWDIKLQVEASLGTIPGLAYARQLFTDWSQMSPGHDDFESASCLTAGEVLAVDDDDADPSNGTPHSTEICAAFARHNIVDCPGACP